MARGTAHRRWLGLLTAGLRLTLRTKFARLLGSVMLSDRTEVSMRSMCRWVVAGSETEQMVRGRAARVPRCGGGAEARWVCA